MTAIFSRSAHFINIKFALLDVAEKSLANGDKNVVSKASIERMRRKIDSVLS